MEPKIFVNLPVKDLKTSMDFYTRIGFTNNPMFTDHTAAAMVFSEHIYVMLLTHDKLKQFTKRPIGDTKNYIASICALQVHSVARMNELADAAIAAGGTEAAPPEDHGFMQQRSVEDPDGHHWEFFYMDINKFPQPQ